MSSSSSKIKQRKLSQAYIDHPTVWLDPSVYNAQNQPYSSVDHATRAYVKEKQQIISLYERQLQRVLSQFSIALKQIEYLEDFRKQQNITNHHLNTYPASSQSSAKSNSPMSPSLHSSPLPTSPRRSSIGRDYDSTIDQLHRKIKIMHEEMVSMKNLYTQKIDIIQQESSDEINELKAHIRKLTQIQNNNNLSPNNIILSQSPPFTTLHNMKSASSDDSEEMAKHTSYLRNRLIPNTPSNWVPEKKAISVEDENIVKLQKMEKDYYQIQSDYKESQQEIENLKLQIQDNNDKIQKMDQGNKTPKCDAELLASLKTQNNSLKKQLKNASIQQNRLLQMQKNDQYMKAKKRIVDKEERKIKEEEWKLARDQEIFNKEQVIDAVTREYHYLQEKEEEQAMALDELHAQLENVKASHNKQLSEIQMEHDQEMGDMRSTFLAKIERQRQHMQAIMNAMLLQQQQRNNSIGNGRRPSTNIPDIYDGRRASYDHDELKEQLTPSEKEREKDRRDIPGTTKFSVLKIESPTPDNGIPNGGLVNGPFGRSFESEHSESLHSRNDSGMSAISASADEIVPSLVLGIDEKLDEMLTPVPGNQNDGLYGVPDFGDVPDLKIKAHAGQQPSSNWDIVHVQDYSNMGITPRDSNNQLDHPYHNAFASIESQDMEEPEPADMDPVPITSNPVLPANNPSTSSNSSRSWSAQRGLRGKESMLLENVIPAAELMNLFNPDMNDAVEAKVKSITPELLAQQNLEMEKTVLDLEHEKDELQTALDKMLKQNQDQEDTIKELKDKLRKAKRREFDWVAKEKDWKTMLAQYRELRENNAKLTLTYFTLQCEYDKLKRDYDEKSAMIMNYGDYQINLTNQIMISNDNTSSNNSSNRNLLLSNNNSNDINDMDGIGGNHGLNGLGDFQFQVTSMSPPNGGIMAYNEDLDILSDGSDEDEVDMVVGFMASTAQRNTQVMNVNDISLTTSPPNGISLDVLKHNKQQLSTMSVQSHGYNMSYFGNNIAFQYTAKTKDELIEEVLKLRDKLSEMTDTKFEILQSTTQEIDRLKSKVKMLEESKNKDNYNFAPHFAVNDLEHNIQEIQLDQEMTKSDGRGHEKDRKQRKSFGGGTIGIMSNDNHTYKVSKNNLDTVTKQLTNRPHTRTQSMMNSKYLSPGTPSVMNSNSSKRTTVIIKSEDMKDGFDEDHSDDDNNDNETKVNENQNDNDNNNNKEEENNNQQEQPVISFNISIDSYADESNNDNTSGVNDNEEEQNGHVKSLTFLHNITESEEIKID